MTLRSHPITSHYVWNETAGRYTNLETGRFVPFAEVRDALESVMDASAVRMHDLTQQLISNQVSLAEWQAGMMDQIKASHAAASAAANGGWAQMNQSDWGAAGRMIQDQYEYLRNFANEIADGTQPLDGRALVRANLYGDASRGTFEQMRRRYETLTNGMEEERRDLGAADHCEDCLDVAALGWQPIGTLPAIGDSQCTVHCHCTFKFRKMGPDGEFIEGEEGE